MLCLSVESKSQGEIFQDISTFVDILNPEMLNPYIKLYIQADENRRSLREIKFPSCDKIKLT